MFKKYKKQLIISSIVTLLPMVLGLIIWNRLPDSFATHWGVDGQPDGYSSKAFGVFFTPIFLLFLNLFCVWITDLTNRGNEQSPKVMNMVFCMIPIISLLSNGMVYAIALGQTWEMTNLLPVTLGLLFALVGNYLPKCTRNSTVGIKVIWALRNEENWNATHRFAGRTWVAAGLLTVFTVFLPNSIGYPIMFVSLLGAGLGAMLYSYLYYRKQLKEGSITAADALQLDPTAKKLGRAGCIMGSLILVFCVFVMFTGSIEYDFREDALVMDATFYTPITLRYENVEDVQYREGNVDGTRTGGFGSFKLLLGYFENEEFGTYSRYTYYKPDGCIVVTYKGDTLVFSGADAAETRALYQELLNRIG